MFILGRFSAKFTDILQTSDSVNTINSISEDFNGGLIEL